MIDRYVRPTRGTIRAPILVVCDSPTVEAHTMGLPMSAQQLKWLGEVVVDEGLDPKQDFYIIGLCPPILKEDKNSASRKWAHVLPHVEDMHNVIARAEPRLVVTFGELATRAVLGRPVKITKARGMPVPRDGQATVLPMLSPGFVARLPDHKPTFVADVHTVAMLKASDFDVSRIERTETNYQWRTDISDFLGENKPGVIAVDTETTGLRWWEEGVVPITVQFSTGPGVGIVCCVDEVYWRRWLEPVVGPYNRRTRSRLVGQLSELLEDPEVRKIGQNLKYDHHICRKLNVEVNGWLHDTMVMGFAVDENALSLGLDELVRVHVPEMSGYADCVAPDTLVLASDMRKVRAGDLRIGDLLCAFTAETNGGKAQRRKMRRATVLGTQRIRRSCLRVTTESGRTTVVSDGHLFLCKRGMGDQGGGWRWRRADSLRVGSVLKPFAWEDPAEGFDAGYVSGILDGEGWVHRGRSRVGVAQRDNVVLAEFRRIVGEHGLVASHSSDKRKAVPVVNDTFDGHACFKMLQKFRPRRLLEDARWEGCGLPTNGEKYDPVVSIENLGEQEVVGLRTSTETIIADGLLSHNSFNRTYDKADMRSVPPEDFLTYAGGDPDATFRLARVLQSRLRTDPKQQRVYRSVQMPAVMCFANVVEPYGMRVDKGRLRELGQQVDEWLAVEYRKLIRAVPARVRRKHLNDGKDLVFSRPDFVRDTLFSPDGFGLEPVVFTKSTRDLEDVTKRVPSTSAKEHLPYFTGGDHLTQEVKDFAADLMEFQRTQKLKNTYYGDEEEGTGFWKYLSPTGRLHPSFGVTFTNTGRTNSRDPNAQNFPKRGSQWAKPFGEIFIPTEGYKFVTADLSQIELRIAAWMAMEQTMLRIYREGGDIHVATAAAVLGITAEQFAAYLGDDRPLMEVANEIPGSGDYLRKVNPGKRHEVRVRDFFALRRFQAKGINFGFLYGMGWRKFMSYAKTEFGMDVTEEEAQMFRDTFFNLYPGLVAWHETMRGIARDQGYVRSLHGACRHLPSINSSDIAMQRASERFAVNSPVQRFGSDLGLIAFARLTHQADPDIMRALNFVHDQLITEVREGHVEECGAALKWVMETPPLREWFDIEPPLPIFSDLESGYSLGSLEEQDTEARKPDWWVDDEAAAMTTFLASRRAAGAAL